MGCFSSRFDRRNVQSSDFNTVAAAFLGGKDKEVFDRFPVDRVLAALAKDAEPADFIKVEDDLKLADETQTTEFYQGTLKFLSEHSENLTKQYGSAADAKEVYVNDKYLAKDVLEGV